MTALDTNIVLRIILRDDPEQMRPVEALVAAGPCLVATTVLLETAWVLGSYGGMSPARIAAAIRTLLDVPNLFVADEPAVRAALDDVEAGLDVADAVHRAFSPGATRLATFDRHLADAAAGRPGLPIDLL